MSPGERPQGKFTASSTDNRGSRRGLVLAATASIVLAGVTAFFGGLGSRLADLVASSDSPLVSFSASESGNECLGGVFLPSGPAAETLQQGPPADWSVLEHKPGAAYVGRDPVEVSIQGESNRTVTLTGIAFKVSRRPSRPGAVFNAPCGGPMVGRALEVDLDSEPPRIVNSSAEKDGMLGSRGANGERLTQPIRFPWTVSLTDPLLLDVVATTKAHYDVWSAEISWASGSQHGTMLIDNDGRGYRVAAGEGLPTYTWFDGAWQD